MDTRSKRLQFLAKEYVQHTRAMSELNEELNDLKAELIMTMRDTEGVEVDVNTVLIVVEKPSERKPVTQKLMREPGVSVECMARILKATAPSGRRGKKIKTVLLDAFLAAQDRRRDAVGRGASGLERESISDEEDN